MSQSYLLYRILEEIEDLISINPETGELLEFDDERFEELQLQKAEKEEQLALVVKNLRAENKVIDEELKNLQKRMNTNKQIIERAIACLDKSLDGDRVDTPRVKTYYRTSWRVIIDNEAVIPEEFIKTERSVMKSAIGDAIKSGIEVLGARRERGTTLLIK